MTLFELFQSVHSGIHLLIATFAPHAPATTLPSTLMGEESTPVAIVTVAFAIAAGLLVRRNVLQRRHMLKSEERHRLEGALNGQRITRQQNEALTEEIRERKRIEIELRHVAFHDSLTGLYNRARLLDVLNDVLHETRSSTKPRAELLYLDLDSFKVVNDTFGHPTGDLFLLEISERLKQFIRPTDMVARIGGNEFAILLQPLNSLDQSTRMVQRLLSVVEQPITHAGMVVPLTASIGVCEVVLSYAEAEEVLRDADTAMYRAKRAGGAQYVRYDPAMQVDALAVLQSKLQLKAAVANEEFVLFYQPLVNLPDRSIYGMEALIRWNHPTRGLLPPGAFIQLAEETGHIVAMGTWVMHQACLDLQRFQKVCDRPLVMSLNVCSKQLDVPNFMDGLRRALDTSQVDPACVQLEITESIFIKDAVRIGRMFEEIRELGVQIAFDDFGTGYSSLSYLERYPIDTLKLDQSFVQAMGEGTVNAEIVQLVINLADAIGMKVTAEGVEEEEQALTLLEYGCVLAQGYHFSKPISFDRMMDLVVADGHERRARPKLASPAPVLPFRPEPLPTATPDQAQQGGRR